MKHRDMIAEFGNKAAWSPDGTRLVYFGAPSVPPYESDMRGIEMNLRMYDLRTKKTVSLVKLKAVWITHRPSWSPDGKHIVFSVSSDKCCLQDVPYFGLAPREKAPQLMVVDVESRKSEQVTLSGGITCASDPSWAPDGKSWVVFECTKDRRGLALIEPTGKLIKRLTEPAQDDFDRFPAWSPDGRQVVFTSSRSSEGNNDSKHVQLSIFVVNSDGTNLHVLIPGSAKRSVATPTWSSDGKLLAFLGIEPSQLEMRPLPGFGVNVIVLEVENGQVRATLGGVSDPALAPLSK